MLFFSVEFFLDVFDRTDLSLSLWLEAGFLFVRRFNA